MRSRDTSTLVLAVSLACAAAGSAGCGRTSLEFLDSGDDGTEETTIVPDDSSDSGEETSETGWDTDDGTDDGSFIPDDTGESDTGVEPKTCREMLECVLGCAISLDPACFQACGEGADPAELEKAIGLMTCVAGLCIQNGECVIPDFAAEECLGCIGLGLFLPEPPGCEDVGAACM